MIWLLDTNTSTAVDCFLLHCFHLFISAKNGESSVENCLELDWVLVTMDISLLNIVQC